MRPITVLLVTVVVVLSNIAMLGVGRGVGLRSERAFEGSTRARDAKIVARVVEVNPRATLRDFDGDFPAFLVKLSVDNGLDYRFVMAMIEKESGWRPDAVGSSGEVGLMQVLPSTAALVASARGLSYDPPTLAKSGGYSSLGTLGSSRDNVIVGVAYLADQVKVYGVNATAVRGYNRSPNKATEHRPNDRYAEDVALRFLSLAHQLPR